MSLRSDFVKRNVRSVDASLILFAWTVHNLRKTPQHMWEKRDTSYYYCLTNALINTSIKCSFRKPGHSLSNPGMVVLVSSIDEQKTIPSTVVFAWVNALFTDLQLLISQQFKFYLNISLSTVQWTTKRDRSVLHESHARVRYSFAALLIYRYIYIFTHR